MSLILFFLGGICSKKGASGSFGTIRPEQEKLVQETVQTKLQRATDHGEPNGPVAAENNKKSRKEMNKNH